MFIHHLLRFISSIATGVCGVLAATFCPVEYQPMGFMLMGGSLVMMTITVIALKAEQ